jgi:hypothetical protein
MDINSVYNTYITSSQNHQLAKYSSQLNIQGSLRSSFSFVHLKKDGVWVKANLVLLARIFHYSCLFGQENSIDGVADSIAGHHVSLEDVRVIDLHTLMKVPLYRIDL